jgi:hypothetical protein
MTGVAMRTRESFVLIAHKFRVSNIELHFCYSLAPWTE